jgi:hypothetical protein
MIKKEDVDLIDSFTEAQKKLICDLIDRHTTISYIRRWISTQEAVTVNKISDPDLVGKTDFWLTNISSDAIIESVIVYKNGLLLKSPYPNYGYPWVEQFPDKDFSIDIKSAIQFIPPMEIHLKLVAPLIETDTIVAMVFYRSYVHGDYNFADAIADLLLKRKREDIYLDRDFHLFKAIPDHLPELIPTGIKEVTNTPIPAMDVKPTEIVLPPLQEKILEMREVTATTTTTP